MNINIKHPNGVEISISAPEGYQDDFWHKNLMKEAILSLIDYYGDFNSSMIEGGDAPAIWQGLIDIRLAAEDGIEEISGFV